MQNYHRYLTFLNVLLYNGLHEFRYQCGMGKINHSFIFILNGTAEYDTGNEVFRLKSGDMIYIPKGQRYNSHYFGSENISYCNIACSFSPDFPEYRASVKHIPIQKLRFSDFSSTDEIKELHRSFTDRSSSGTDTILKFYKLYAKIENRLTYSLEGSPRDPLQPAMEYMETHLTENTEIKQLAALCSISETYFFRIFKETVKYTPVEYRNRLRIQKAMTMLVNGENSIAEISEKVGFSSDEYFTRTFKKMTRMTPSEYKKRQHISNREQ